MKSFVWIPFFLSATWAQDAATEAATNAAPHDTALAAPADSLKISYGEIDTSNVSSAYGTLPATANEEPGASTYSTYSSTTGTSGNPGMLFFDLRLAAPVNDVQTGGRVGFSVGRRIPVDIFLDMEMRPYRRAVRIAESEMLEYQYREERFTFGPGVLARVPLNPSFAFVAGGGAGLSPAWYRGSNRDAPSAGLGWLETGIRFTSPSGIDWGFSYQFFPLPGVSPHRISFQIGRRISAQ